jgi:hypothetical protein
LGKRAEKFQQLKSCIKANKKALQSFRLQSFEVLKSDPARPIPESYKSTK